MKAKAESFVGITSNKKKLEIPFFQRPYVWKEENWEKLFEDLSQSYKDSSSPFLGSIILKQNQESETSYTVIDGQQRLTTFSILLKSIINLILENNTHINISHFENCLFNINYKGKDIKILHSYIDRERYNEVLNDRMDKTIKNSRIYNCYNYFSSKIGEEFSDAEKKFNFADYLINKDVFVVISIDHEEDEQKIFDSINSTGEKLTATDIIKNAILDKAVKMGDEKKANDLYNEYWQNIFEKNEEESLFWNSETKIGHTSSRVKSEILLQSVATILGFYNISKGHKIEQLSSLYKDYIKDFDIEKIQECLNNIKVYANTFREIQSLPKDEIFLYSNKKQMLFHTLKEFDTNVFMPLVLLLINKLDNEEKKLFQCFNLIQSFIVYCSLCNYETSGYNTMIQKIISNILKSKKEKIISIIHEHFENFLNNSLENIVLDVAVKLESIKKKKQVSYILFWIELFREDKNKDITTGLKYNYKLEYLKSMPQNLNSVPEEEKKEIEKLIYQIGNMTLLSGSFNDVIKNADWQTKLYGNGNSRTQCINKNKDLIINKELLDKKEWGKKEIEERSRQLIEDFFQIWTYNDAISNSIISDLLEKDNN